MGAYFPASEIKTYQYAANVVYDELMDKYGMKNLPKGMNINRIKLAIDAARKKGLTPSQAAEAVFKSAENVIKRNSLAAKRAVVKGSAETVEKSKHLPVNKISQTSQGFKQAAGSSGASSVGSEVKSSAAKAMKYRKFGKVAGGIALASLILGSTYYLYKQYLSAAARHCSMKKGEEKKKCIELYRKRAKKIQLYRLQNSLKECDKSKNPNVCRRLVMKKIRKLDK